MLLNLRKALDDKHITVRGYASFLGVSEKTVRNKLDGITDFTYPEVNKTKEELLPEYDIAYLFKACNAKDLSETKDKEVG